MSQIQTEYIFPCPIWWVDFNDLNDEELLRHCYDIEKKSPGRKMSNHGGYQSNFLSVEDKRFSVLLDAVNEAGNFIYDNVYKRYCDVLKPGLLVDSYWMNINRKNDLNMSHVHPGSVLSAAYYVKSVGSDEQGCITFEKNYNSVFIESSQFKIKPNTPTSFLSQEYALPPIEGRLYLFPSSLPHHVSPNLMSNDRVSISFNLSSFDDYDLQRFHDQIVEEQKNNQWVMN